MPFVKGQSGNPAGRPKGKNAETIIRASLDRVVLSQWNSDDGEVPAGETALMDVISKSALEGDMQAVTILVNRMYPQLKPMQPVQPFELDQSSPSAQASSIMRAVADGIIPPEVGKQLIDAVAATLSIEEVTSLADRLAKLEAIISGSKATE